MNKYSMESISANTLGLWGLMFTPPCVFSLLEQLAGGILPITGAGN
jgi:hypothetical protein